MRNKALTDSVLMLCLSIVLFADQKNKKENERRLTQTRIHTDFYHFTEIGQIQPRDLPLQNGRDLGTRLQPIKLPGVVRLQPPPPPEACTFGACLRNRSALILCLLPKSDLIYLRAFLHTTLKYVYLRQLWEGSVTFCNSV